MRYWIGFGLLWTTLLITIACSTPAANGGATTVQANRSGGLDGTPIAPVSPLPPVSTATTVSVTSTTTYTLPLSTNPKIRIPVTILGWSVYTNTLGFSLEYPTGWQINDRQLDKNHYVLGFTLPDDLVRQGGGWSDGEIILHSNGITGFNPYNVPPNESGFAVHWPNPLNISNGTGVLYVWGEENFDKWQSAAYLTAWYYSPGLGLEFTIGGGDFDAVSVEMTHQIGFVRTVRQRFSVFDHIARSVRFAK